MTSRKPEPLPTTPAWPGDDEVLSRAARWWRTERMEVDAIGALVRYVDELDESMRRLTTRVEEYELGLRVPMCETCSAELTRANAAEPQQGSATAVSPPEHPAVPSDGDPLPPNLYIARAVDDAWEEAFPCETPEQVQTLVSEGVIGARYQVAHYVPAPVASAAARSLLSRLKEASKGELTIREVMLAEAMEGEVEVLVAALRDCPLPRTDGNATEFYGRFYDWYKGQRAAALEDRE